MNKSTKIDKERVYKLYGWNPEDGDFRVNPHTGKKKTYTYRFLAKKIIVILKKLTS